jgi:hypothetical protein
MTVGHLLLNVAIILGLFFAGFGCGRLTLR